MIRSVLVTTIATFQYLAIIVAVVDILGAIVGWSIIMKA